MDARTRRPIAAAALALASLAVGGCPGKQCNLLQNPNCNGRAEFWLFAYPQSEVAEILQHLGAHRGLVAVRETIDASSGLHNLEVLEKCRIEGGYTYNRSPTTDQHVEAHKKSELQAALPFTWAAFSARFEQSSYVNVTYRSAGYFKAELPDRRYQDASCAEATHVVGYILAGAYDTSFGSNESQGAGVQSPMAPGGGIGASSQNAQDSKTAVGSFDECGGSDTSLGGAPLECGQPLQLALVPIDRIPVDPDPPTSCRDEFTTANTSGYYFDANSMTFNVTADEMASAGIDSMDPHFTCGAGTFNEEAAILGRIVDWLKDHPRVKAHVSVRCNTMSAMQIPPIIGAPNLHKQNISDVFAPVVQTGQIVSLDSCYVPSKSGVYVELVGGCAEGAIAPEQLACTSEKP